MRKIIATTDVLAHENRYPKGTGFSVVEKPNPKAEPPQIDPTTADRWQSTGWAKPDDTVAEKAKP